jgi:hypothetical protein
VWADPTVDAAAIVPNLKTACGIFGFDEMEIVVAFDEMEVVVAFDTHKYDIADVQGCRNTRFKSDKGTIVHFALHGMAAWPDLSGFSGL